MKLNISLPIWSMVAPVFAWLVFFGNATFASNWYLFVLGIALMGSVVTAVHHAEVIAHRVGEPFGSLILAIAITIIEVSLIVSFMVGGGAGASEIARDTVFAAVMIILTGIIGICLLSGGARHREQSVVKSGVDAGLVTLTAICVLALVLPNYTTSVAGPVYNSSQLVFVAIVSLILYGTFVMIQAVRHRDYFLPPEADRDVETHAAPPSNATVALSLVLLLIALGAVVLLAKSLAPAIEAGVDSIGAPKSIVGIIVAMVILLPEGVAAWRAAKKNRLQTSLNLAIGSALASIGLTIPAVAIVSVITGMPVTLGIDTRSTVLLVLSLFIINVTFGTGRTTLLQGVVLLMIFAVYLFTTIVP